ncbi:MAG: hypothetical protein RB292_01715 [Patescibacteria group bacterium]|jgi:hypothetical protein|nr:hypothetical protein [Patescibacteria group bacterium]
MSELEKDGFIQAMNQAVLTVLANLPDRKIEADVVIDLACGEVSPNQFSVEQTELARRTVRSLVRKTPRCYGVNRRSGWWRIILQYLTPKQAVEAYLWRFPDSMTVDQRRSIIDYLIVNLAFDRELVERQVFERRFVIVPNRGCHHQQRNNSRVW